MRAPRGSRGLPWRPHPDAGGPWPGAAERTIDLVGHAPSAWRTAHPDTGAVTRRRRAVAPRDRTIHLVGPCAERLADRSPRRPPGCGQARPNERSIWSGRAPTAWRTAHLGGAGLWPGAAERTIDLVGHAPSAWRTAHPDTGAVTRCRRAVAPRDRTIHLVGPCAERLADRSPRRPPGCGQARPNERSIWSGRAPTAWLMVSRRPRSSMPWRRFGHDECSLSRSARGI
jgi:hypothetical protein